MDADNDRAGYRPVSFGLFAFMADGSADFGSLHVHCRHDALYQSLADFPRHSAQRQHESGAARRLSVRVQPGSADEIGDLYLGFNDMVEALDNSIQTIRRDDEKRHDLEIRILQEQINPHFIRNTLNTIRWMAELKGAAGISKAISAFICMINYSFSGIDHAVSLRDELFYLEKYIYIQKLRYQNLFTYEAQVPGELLDAQIPKLILQPIVENSVLHGIAERAEAGPFLSRPLLRTAI